MTKPRVTIPRTPLRAQIDEAAAIKAEMTRLLRDLQHAANKEAPDQPGAWRHHPETWPAKTDRSNRR